jgi:hypothetical protein
VEVTAIDFVVDYESQQAGICTTLHDGILFSSYFIAYSPYNKNLGLSEVCVLCYVLIFVHQNLLQRVTQMPVQMTWGEEAVCVCVCV